jgi:hypothetical protein
MRAFMEYIENTFKICKETKRDTIFRKAKEPKEEKALPGQIRAEAYGEKGPKTNQTISKWRETLQAWPIHAQRPTRQRRW